MGVPAEDPFHPPCGRESVIESRPELTAEARAVQTLLLTRLIGHAGNRDFGPPFNCHE